MYGVGGCAPRRDENRCSSRKEGNVSVTICASCIPDASYACRRWNASTNPWNDPPNSYPQHRVWSVRRKEKKKLHIVRMIMTHSAQNRADLTHDGDTLAQQRDTLECQRRSAEYMFDEAVRTTFLRRIEGRVCDRDTLFQRWPPKKKKHINIQKASKQRRITAHTPLFKAATRLQYPVCTTRCSLPQPSRHSTP